MDMNAVSSGQAQQKGLSSKDMKRYQEKNLYFDYGHKGQRNKKCSQKNSKKKMTSAVVKKKQEK